MRERGGPMEDSAQELDKSAGVLGLPVQDLREQIDSATAELRICFDGGMNEEHPRCEALLNFINSARLHLEPKESHPAQRRDKLSRTGDEIANHIDSSTVTFCNLIGVQNSNTLAGRASEVFRASPAALSATGQPLPPVPETRSLGPLGNVDARTKRAPHMKLRLQPIPSRNAVKSILDLARVDKTLGEKAILHKEISKTRQPRKRTKRKSRAAEPKPQNRAALAQLMPPPKFRISASPQPQHAHQMRNGVRYPPPTAHYGNHAPYAPRPTPPTFNNTAALGTYALGPRPMSSPVVHQFMNPTHLGVAGQVDPGLGIRAVLAERERSIYRQINQRQAELISLPMGVSEEIRRKAVIESKQMQLIEMQRVVRSRLCVEMKKTWSPAYQECGVVPSDNLSRLFRRTTPTMYSFTDGYPRIGPFDMQPPLPQRSQRQIAWDSHKMAQYDQKRMRELKAKKKHIFASKLMKHVHDFESFHSYGLSVRNRNNKGILKYFYDKARAEEKRKKQEKLERLRLLRSNDEQAYLNLLETTKNERLLQLVRQTDNYLMQIGAQVEKTRDQNSSAMVDDQNVFDDELAVAGKTGLPMDEMRRRRDMYYTVTHSVEEDVAQPSIMVHGKLKPYQIEGLKWMISLYNNNLNGILADEMGLGKTIQTIALLTYLVEKKNNPGPFLIIVPLSTVGNWVRELDLWAPSLTKIIFRGNKDARRHAQYRMNGHFNILITTYEFVVRDQHVLSRTHWKYIIMDEGHRLKNVKCKLATTLQTRYRSKNRLLLTGTPLQNNLTELWALLNFLLPSIFSSAGTFETWFKKPFEDTTLGDSADLEEEETWLVINRLHQVLRPFLLRRLKTDVETQLPEKSESVIRCDMSVWQRALYRQVERKVSLATGANGTTKSYNNLLMQCKKICNHPYLFYDDEAVLNLQNDFIIRSSGKFHLLQNLIPKLKSRGHRTLIFSQMTSALDYLEDFLEEINIQYMRLDGTTKAEERQGMLNEFNAPNSPYFCFLLSTRAGGLGLNLQTADTVIIFDSDWNPMMDLQAQDRAHRIGQKNAVRVFRLISSGTVEVKILDKANKKLDVDAKVIQAGQFNNKSTESDQHQMLKGILRQKADDGDELGDVPTLEELNRIVARTEEEFQAYTTFDSKREKENPYHKLLTDESELPSWVLEPEVQHKTAEERQKEYMESHGRGRRKRTEIRDFDQLTEQEWMNVMEGRATVDEVFESRSARKARNVRKNLNFDDEENDEDTPEDTSDEEVEIRPVRTRTSRKRKARPGKTKESSRKRRRARVRRTIVDSEDEEGDIALNGMNVDSETGSDVGVASGSTDSQPGMQSTGTRRSARQRSRRVNSAKEVLRPAQLRLKLRPDVVLPDADIQNGTSLRPLQSDVSIIDAVAVPETLSNGHGSSNHEHSAVTAPREPCVSSAQASGIANGNITDSREANCSAKLLSLNAAGQVSREESSAREYLDERLPSFPVTKVHGEVMTSDSGEEAGSVSLGKRERKSVAFSEEIPNTGRTLRNGAPHASGMNGADKASVVPPRKKVKHSFDEGNETPDPISPSSEESVENGKNGYSVTGSSVKLRLPVGSAPEATAES